MRVRNQGEALAAVLRFGSFGSGPALPLKQHSAVPRKRAAEAECRPCCRLPIKAEMQANCTWSGAWSKLTRDSSCSFSCRLLS